MKSSLAIGLIYMALVGELVQAGSSSSHEWMLFKRQHGKSYESPAEDARRFAIFMATKQRVERHNALGNSSFKMGLNHLSDWTEDELAKLNGVRLDESFFIESQEKLNETETYLAEILGSFNEPVPDELDWRKVPGRVSSVKSQGHDCSSSWAFSIAGALEGQQYGRVFNDSRQVIDLSAQQLIDCSISDISCFGGFLSLGFDDLADLGGIMSDKDYPYTGEEDKCAFDKKKVVMKNAGHVTLPRKDETKLKQVLANFGPIATGLQLLNSFFAYKSGVYSDNDCLKDRAPPDQNVLLVGYGTDPKYGDYWIGKNSMGPDWGENGYFRIKRGVDMCGIAYSATIPKF